MQTPKLFVISAPSGTGKTTIIKQVITSLPTVTLSISHTTRSPRISEKDGVDYFFVDKETFRLKIEQGDFLEWAEVHGNYYGTSKKHIEETIEKGRIVVLDIDVQGAMQVKRIDNIKSVFIFIEPPSMEELIRRLETRGTESKESLERRVSNANKELQYKDQYDYVIINDDLGNAVKEMEELIIQETTSSGK